MKRVDFHGIEEQQWSGDPDAAAELLADAARSLEKGGAQSLFLGIYSRFWDNSPGNLGTIPYG